MLSLPFLISLAFFISSCSLCWFTFIIQSGLSSSFHRSLHHNLFILYKQMRELVQNLKIFSLFPHWKNIVMFLIYRLSSFSSRFWTNLHFTDSGNWIWASLIVFSFSISCSLFKTFRHRLCLCANLTNWTLLSLLYILKGPNDYSPQYLAPALTLSLT